MTEIQDWNNPETQRLAVGNFQLQSQLANQSGQGLAISGYIYSDDDEKTLNARLDLYKRVIDRQQKISEIPLLEAKLSGMRDALAQNQQMLLDISEKTKRGDKVASQEKMNAKNLEVSIKHVLHQIELGEQAIEKLRKEVA